MFNMLLCNTFPNNFGNIAPGVVDNACERCILCSHSLQANHLKRPYFVMSGPSGVLQVLSLGLEPQFLLLQVVHRGE